jgi:AraC-like DNA-binding protein
MAMEEKHGNLKHANKLRKSVSIRKRWFFSYIAVLFIPLIGFSAVTLHTRRMIFKEIVQSNTLVNEAIQKSLDNHILQGIQIATNLILDTRFRTILLKRNEWQDIVQQQENLISLIRNYKSTSPILDILIYVQGRDYIFTTTTANTLPFLFDALQYQGYSSLNREEWRNYLVESTKHQYISNSYLSYNEFGKDALVYCANTDQADFSNCYMTAIYISFQYAVMEKFFDRRKDSFVLILDPDGIPIHSFGIEAPDLRINLTNAASGYEIIRYGKDDYVCTVRRSETSPFAYAVMTRQTSFWERYNAIERIALISMALALVIGITMSAYLLKLNYRPVRSVLNIFNKVSKEGEKQLNEFDLIREHVLSLINDRDQMESEIIRQERFLRENILYTALTRNRQFLSNDDLMESIGLDLNERKLIPVSVFPVNLERSQLAFAIQDPYTGITLSSLLDNKLRELIEDKMVFYKTNIEQTVVFVFFVKNGHEEYFYNKIQEIMKKFSEYFYENISLVLNIVIGNAAQSVDMLFSCYQEMRSLHTEKDNPDNYTIRRVQYGRQISENGNLLTNEFVQLIQEAIVHYSRDSAFKIVNDYLLSLEKTNYPFHILSFYVFSFVSNLLDMLPFPSAHDNIIALHEILGSISDADNKEDLQQNLLRFVYLFFDDPPEKTVEGEGVSPKIKKYIQNNYTDINLNLTMIADSIDLSEKYISKLFKMETGQGLLHYIGAVRIQRAKELLNGGEYTLNEISEMVGYASIKTFRRVFRKIEGVNPSDYKTIGSGS